MTRNENEGSLEDEGATCTLLLVLVFEELELRLSVDLLLKLLGLCLVDLVLLNAGSEGSQAKQG
ncbi:hypothetical protein QZM26_29350 [Burkholderia multivorans]|nr:hypothetical protein [Burkholderia multivorans]